ncbi:MAG: LysR family transcriptional regulator [Pseudomonadota bacterium]
MGQVSLKIMDDRVFGPVQPHTIVAGAPVAGQAQAAAVAAPSLPPSAQLDALTAVHQEGSFSGAARALGVGQPAVSKRIKALEAALGAQLVDRQTGGLTPAGQNAAQAIETHMSALARGLRSIRATETALSVAVPPGATGTALRTLIDGIQAERIDPLTYATRAAHAAVTFQAQRAGKDAESVFLFADEWAAVAGPNWPHGLNLEARSLAGLPLLATSPAERAAWGLLLQDEDPVSLTDMNTSDAQVLIDEGRALGIANVPLMEATGATLTIASRRRAWPGTSLWACLRDGTPAWDHGWALLNALQGIFTKAD